MHDDERKDHFGEGGGASGSVHRRDSSIDARGDPNPLPKSSQPPSQVPSLQFMDVVEDTARDADDEDFQVAPGFVFQAARDINGDVFAELDFGVVQAHAADAVEDIINLVSALVVMEFGVGDFEVVNFGRGVIFFLDERSNLAACFSPRLHGSNVTAQKGCLRSHARTLRR